MARWRGRPRGAEGLIDPVAGSLAREPASGGGIGITGPSGSGTNTYAISDSRISGNRAVGGQSDAGPAGTGRDGLGGGIDADAATDLSLMGVVIEYNRAIGGTGGPGASDGQGIGGGAYVVGTFSEDSSTVITKNHAFTNHDNIGP